MLLFNLLYFQDETQKKKNNKIHIFPRLKESKLNKKCDPLIFIKLYKFLQAIVI